jgi:hypothetical protein
LGLAVVTAAIAIGIASGSAPAAPQTAPATWAKAICASATQWSTSIQKHAGVLQHLNSTTNIKSVKTLLVAFLSGSVTDTQKLITAIKKAGAPNIKNGKAAQATLIGGFTQLKGYFAADAKKAKALSTDPLKFALGASKLARSIGPQMAKVGTVFASLKTKYPSKSLNKAFASSTCGG